MYEEDRQTALAMYNRLFDEVGDEQGLLQLLVSPTRQAVVIARSYNAKERKLQVHAQSREDDGEPGDGSVPQFVSVIDGLREEALSRQAPKVVEVSADQFSMFEDDFYAPTPDGAEAEESPAAEAETEEAPAAEPDAAPAEEQPEEAPAVIEELAVEIRSEADEAAEEAPAEAPAEETEAEEAPAEESDAVDAFLEDFEIVDPEIGDDEEQAIAAHEESETEELAGDGEHEDAIVLDEESYEYSDDWDDYEDEVSTVRKPRVFLLILYILLAIPVGLIGILVLVIPTVIFLALSALLVTLGVVAVTTAFAHLPLFADVIVAIGAAFILLALGLLTLWIAVWFVGGVMVGLVRGLVHLGGKWCYKEVEA